MTQLPHVKMNPDFRHTLREGAAQSLRSAIWSGELNPGDRINERLISEQLGISRPPLREAIRQLEAEGLIEVIAHHGARVKTPTYEEVRDLYAVRWSLERTAAESIIAGAGSIGAIADLKDHLSAVESAAEHSVSETFLADLEFHRALVTSCGIKRLATTWGLLVGELRLAVRLIEPSYFSAAYVHRTHTPLVQAIIARDRDAVRECFDDLHNVGQELAEAWELSRGITRKASA